MRVKLHSFGDAFCTGTQNVDTVISVVVGGGYEVPSIDTVGVPGAAVVRYVGCKNHGHPWW